MILKEKIPQLKAVSNLVANPANIICPFLLKFNYDMESCSKHSANPRKNKECHRRRCGSTSKVCAWCIELKEVKGLPEKENYCEPGEHRCAHHLKHGYVTREFIKKNPKKQMVTGTFSRSEEGELAIHQELKLYCHVLKREIGHGCEMSLRECVKQTSSSFRNNICRIHNCNSPLRICYACSEQGEVKRVGIQPYLRAVKDGLCAMHTSKGVKITRPELQQALKKRLAESEKNLRRKQSRARMSSSGGAGSASFNKIDRRKKRGELDSVGDQLLQTNLKRGALGVCVVVNPRKVAIPAALLPKRHLDHEYIRQLEMRLREGIKEDVIYVTRHKGRDGYFSCMLVAGREQLLAAKSTGINEIEVEFVEIPNEGEIFLHALILEDYLPQEMGNALMQAQKKFHYSIELLCSALGQSRKWVTNHLKLVQHK